VAPKKEPAAEQPPRAITSKDLLVAYEEGFRAARLSNSSTVSWNTSKTKQLHDAILAERIRALPLLSSYGTGPAKKE
jgi:hypothetical protein